MPLDRRLQHRIVHAPAAQVKIEILRSDHPFDARCDAVRAELRQGTQQVSRAELAAVAARLRRLQVCAIEHLRPRGFGKRGGEKRMVQQRRQQGSVYLAAGRYFAVFVVIELGVVLAHRPIQQGIARPRIAGKDLARVHIGGQVGEIGDAAQVEQDAVFARFRQDQVIAIHRQGRPLAARRHVPRPKIAERNDARDVRHLVAVADLQGGVAVIGQAVLHLGGVKHRLAVRGHQVNLTCRDAPLRQTTVDHLAVDLPDFGVQQAEVLKIDFPFGKYPADFGLELGRIGHGVKGFELHLGGQPGPLYPAEGHVKPIERGARHQADDAAGGGLGDLVEFLQV